MDAVNGGLPLNVKVLIEGEEECGGVHLDDFLKLHHGPGWKADVAVVSDTSQYGDGIPAITCGLRGIVAGGSSVPRAREGPAQWCLRRQSGKSGQRTDADVRGSDRPGRQGADSGIL
ncbi:MAG UNVERIFIED_CONTAM: hypothetical protein LVR18_49480 [Planctomycetaceae bacterium]